MSRRFVPMLIATAVAGVLLPTTAAQARCGGELTNPGTVVCIAHCVRDNALPYC